MLFGCKTTTEVVTVYQHCDCPLPVEVVDGYRIPQKAHQNYSCSPDGKWLAFTVNSGTASLNLLNLKTLEITSLPTRSFLPDTGRYTDANYCTNVLWCPYDNNKLLMDCHGSFASGSSYNSYIYNISTKKVERITSPLSGVDGGFYFSNWLRGSKEGLDSLYDGSQIYVPQEDKFYPKPEGYLYFMSQSYAKDNSLIYDFSGAYYTLYINGNRYGTGSYMKNIEHISWSPSGNKIAFSTQSYTPGNNPDNHNGDFEEIWIYDLRYFGEEVYRLNLQDLFCKYSFRGISAEYITDSTLAVSMHKDGDKTSPLWEITDKGKIVRQLTF